MNQFYIIKIDKYSIIYLFNVYHVNN